MDEESTKKLLDILSEGIDWNELISLLANYFYNNPKPEDIETILDSDGFNFWWKKTMFLFSNNPKGNPIKDSPEIAIKNLESRRRIFRKEVEDVLAEK